MNIFNEFKEKLITSLLPNLAQLLAYCIIDLDCDGCSFEHLDSFIASIRTTTS